MPVPDIFTREMVADYTRKGYWGDRLMSDFWDQNARLYPDKEALVSPSVRLTWSQAKKSIDRIALGLLESGIRRDDVIVIQLYNCVEYLLIRLACEKAGVVAAVAPFAFRGAELEPIMKQIGAVGIVIPWQFRSFNCFEMVESLRPNVPSLRHVFVTGDKVPPGALSIKQIAEQPWEDKYPENHLGKTRFKSLETARITITSGSTGAPKCAERTSVLAGHEGYVERMRITQQDITAAFAPVTAGINDKLVYFAAPRVAAKIVLLEHFTPEAACQLIEKEKVTVAGCVPAVIARLVGYPDLNKYDLSSLRLIISSTAVLPYHIGVEAEDKLGCIVAQSYGSIDGGGLTASDIGDSREARLGTVGRPYDGNEIKLVNDEGDEVPQGQIGNVVARGPQVSCSYFGNPALTHESWKDGWFHLGELGQFDRDGNLIILGRRKDTINRGGHKIYPKEIENLLVQHPKVSDAAVVRMPDPIMGEKACAYVVPKPGKDFVFEDMLSFLEGRNLATFKLPERIETVSELPLVPGGQKIDRRKLEDDVASKLKAEAKS